jgi:hypothetical protein
LKKTPAILALALLIALAAAGCSNHGGDYSTPPSDGAATAGGSTGGSTGGGPTGGTTGDSTGGTGGDGSGGSGGGSTPTLPTTPPANGTTAWAPAASDGTFVNVRSFGAVGDGVTDDTAAFRAAAATGKVIFVPAPSVAYVLTRFVPLQSSIYGDGSMPLIKFVGADGDPDQGHTRNMLFVYGYRGAGLVIQGLHLDGQWTGGGNGEWSHNLNIGTSSNVTVQHNTLERPYGDNIFVGEFVRDTTRNVVIRNNNLVNPRRCNIGINSADGVTIRDNHIVKTSNYVSAIDLEPDPLGFQYVSNVTIASNDFEVATLAWGAGTVSMNNPNGNSAAPVSGNVTVTDNHGSWTNVFGYMDVGAGADGLVGVVPHLPWPGLTVSGNSKG